MDWKRNGWPDAKFEGTSAKWDLRKEQQREKREESRERREKREESRQREEIRERSAERAERAERESVAIGSQAFCLSRSPQR